MRLQLTTLLVCALAGCGGASGNANDGGTADADTSGSCRPAFGSSFVVDQFMQAPVGQGFDLNGDGKPDNAFGVVGINSDIWHNLITTGSAIFLFDFHGLPTAGTAVADGAALELAFYLGVGVSADPTTYYTGSGQFLAPASQFDVNCQTTADMDSVDVSGGGVDAHKSMLGLGVHGLGILQFSKFVLRGTLSADQQTWAGLLGGVATPCGLSQLPSLSGAGSLLGSMVNMYMVEPDVDVDGDGLDKINGDGTDVASCTTSDGTVIQGASCACDPRIKDGFSGAFAFSAVPAMIVGLAPQ